MSDLNDGDQICTAASYMLDSWLFFCMPSSHGKAGLRTVARTRCSVLLTDASQRFHALEVLG